MGIASPNRSTSRPRERNGIRGRLLTTYGIILAATLLAWIWACYASLTYPPLLGLALLAYAYGLRHAVDADHIAAIDNVTRKLMQEGKRPVDVGFFFSLGHSCVVILASAAVALTAGAFKDRIDVLANVGGIIGTCVSAGFLFLLALLNIIIFCQVYLTFQRVKKTGFYSEEDFNILMSKSGFFSRIFRPLFGMIHSSWQMFPIGFLFGLGFDTSTEVVLLGISAAQAAKGLSIITIMVFPALFTAGMTLVDTTDGALMLGAYQWAFVTPIRKLYYNLTITAVSVVVALVIGSIETLGLLGDKFELKGALWELIEKLNDNFTAIGFCILGIFLGAWLLSFLIYRYMRYDALKISVEPQLR